MPIAKVWNDNTYPYAEKFKGEQIRIEAGQCVSMDLDEAHMFLGTYSPPKKRGDGTFDVSSYKKLRIECDFVPEEKLVCHADGTVVTSIEELEEKLKNFKHMRFTSKELESKGSAAEGLAGQVAELQAQVASLVATMQSAPKRGRPRKAISETPDGAEPHDEDDGIAEDEALS